MSRRSIFLASLAASAAAALAPPTRAQATAAVGIDLESVLYPYPVAFFPLTIDGLDLRMAYMDVAPTARPNGRTLVLLHGKNFSGSYWDGTIAAAAAHGYRVVVPDQIGWGKSSKPSIAYSFDLLARNTQSLLAALGSSRVTVVGHSTGGMLATRFVRMYPDAVEQLVLEDSLGMEDYRRAIEPPSFEALYAQELHLDPAAIRRTFTNYLADPARIGIFRPLIDVAVGVLRSADYPVAARASALAYRMIYEEPVCYEYDLIATPALVIVGAADKTAPLLGFASASARATLGHMPDLARRTAQLLAHGKLAVIADCGHVPHLEQRTAFERALFDFLAR